MRFPASDHYEHLDPSQPIPEIELRYNEHARVGYRAFNRFALWAFGAIFISQIALYLMIDSKWLRLILSIVFTFGVIAWMIIDAMKAQRQAGTKRAKDDAWGLPLREQVRYVLFYCLVMWGVMAGFRVTSEGFIGLLTTGVWYLLMLGVTLIAMGRFAREPGQLCCIECDYPLLGLTMPCDCPECGTPVRDLWYVTDRPRARDGHLVLIGVVLTVLGLASIALQFYRPPALYNAMPRPALIRLAPTDHGAFDAIMGTTITPDEDQQLIEGMYKNRVGFVSALTSFEQEDWFGTMIELGRLTTDQLDTLYSDFIRCSIDAPDRARVGQLVRLTLTAEYARSPAQPPYYFGGFVIGDDPTHHARSDKIYSRTFIVNGPEQEYFEKGYVPYFDWTPTEPGEHTIRARVVFAMNTGFTQRSGVTWTNEDLPAFPNTPMWSRIVDLEHTIEIE